MMRKWWKKEQKSKKGNSKSGAGGLARRVFSCTYLLALHLKIIANDYKRVNCKKIKLQEGKMQEDEVQEGKVHENKVQGVVQGD